LNDIAKDLSSFGNQIANDTVNDMARGFKLAETSADQKRARGEGSITPSVAGMFDQSCG
jgi:hypothetical protein